ncbi:hypothetical protein ACFLZJ_00060 [Nanoarchaeota archaeon]
MGVLEETTQLKTQGISEVEIANQLGEQGYSPKEINDALNQSQIKSAISDAEEPPRPPPPRSPNKKAPLTREITDEDVYTPIPQEEDIPIPEEYDSYAAPTQELPEFETYGSESQEPPAVQEFYPQPYGEYEMNAESEIMGTDTMIEMAEQVFTEKTKKMQNQLSELNEFKTLTQTKLDNLSSRLKRMETSFDQLQLAILDRVGAYGKSLQSTKKEMAMMEDSFRKMVNPIANRPTRKHTTRKKTRKPIKRKSKKK